jgi:hypothetical protein
MASAGMPEVLQTSSSLKLVEVTLEINLYLLTMPLEHRVLETE